jgi:isoleucyl-tRNA synthetase
VLANGRFDETVPEFLRGKSTKEANPLIVAELKNRGRLIAEEPILHSYPHDWRSKTPIIFRATEQWFVAMDKAFASASDPERLPPKTLRERAKAAVGFDEEHPLTEFQQAEVGEHEREQRELWLENLRAEAAGKPFRKATTEQLKSLDEKWGPTLKWYARQGIDFIPPWGQNRLRGMLESRPDWCISRQRAWGLPIPVFYNEKGEALLTPGSVRAVAKRFAAKGSDAWFTDSPAELLGDYDTGPNFPKDQLRKEKDIFDVWFESGSSWNSVLKGRDYLKFPADLYLEGSDQHRGWFQLSLLPSLGATGVPPFKGVLTHGFVVKPDGKKVSKSDKEYVTATKEIETHGADLLRLWTCSVDYEGDIPTSPQVIKEFGDKYRKIRNTLRYLMSNLYDFNPATDSQDIPPSSLDGWAASELDALIRGVVDAYDQYQTHVAFKLMFEFCNVQLSAVYGNAMKDRLYCEVPNSPLRRRAQTVMYRMAVALTKLLAPMIPFTADEAWEHLKHKPAGDENLSSVHLALMPTPFADEPTEEQKAEWKRLLELRDSACRQLDALKKEVGMNKALDAEIVYFIEDEATRRKLQAYGPDLEDIVAAGFHTFAEKAIDGPAVSVKVFDRREKYAACARSWKRRPDVGTDAEFPDLSLRDAAAVRGRAKG